MLNPRTLKPGSEQYEFYKPSSRGTVRRVQYDYRHTDGELFSCVKKTPAECRAARDSWVASKRMREASI